MYHYQVSGLALRSSRAVDGLERMAPARLRPWTLAYDRTASRRRHRAAGDLRLRSCGRGSLEISSRHSGTFRVRPATRDVRYAAAPRATREAFLDVLLGPVVSCLLIADGRHPLHGSAVRIGREAVGFLGQDGAGKSTMAAVCSLAGHGVIVDDVLTIAWRKSTPYVMPGYPEIRLWPGSGRRLVPAFDRLPRVVPTAAKRRLDPRRSAGGFVRRPVRLRALYELRRSSTIKAPRVRALSSQETFVTLLRHLYNTALVTRTTLAGQFQQLGMLARRITIRQLLLPRAGYDLTQLPRVVLDDLQCRA